MCDQVLLERKRYIPVQLSDTQGCQYVRVGECYRADLSKSPTNYTIHGIREVMSELELSLHGSMTSIILFPP